MSDVKIFAEQCKIKLMNTLHHQVWKSELQFHGHDCNVLTTKPCTLTHTHTQVCVCLCVLANRFSEILFEAYDCRDKISDTCSIADD